MNRRSLIMSRGRLSFAPESCVKGVVLLDLIGGEDSEKPPERGSSDRFDDRLERWAAETCARILQVRERDPAAFALLMG